MRIAKCFTLYLYNAVSAEIKDLETDLLVVIPIDIWCIPNIVVAIAAILRQIEDIILQHITQNYQTIYNCLQLFDIF